MGALAVVAAKEFRDHLTSRRFLLIFAVLAILSLVGVIAGVGDYNRELKSYKDMVQQQSGDPAFQRSIAELQQQIASAEASGIPQDQVDRLKQALSDMASPPMPSILLVFRNYNVYFTIVGALLAASLGFDLITREKEEGSLKSLLTHPVYRDEVLNGKALGSVAVLAIVLASTFLLTVAVMMLNGIVPTCEDFLSLAIYLAIALVYGTVFFGIALAASTAARSSGMAVAYLMGVVILLVLVPTIVNTAVVFAMGEPPEMDVGPAQVVPEGMELQMSVAESAGVNDSTGGLINSTIYAPGENYVKYWQTRSMITDTVDIVNPISDLNRAAWAALEKGGIASRTSLANALAKVWANILVLVAMAVAAFGYAYVRFMRLDVR